MTVAHMPWVIVSAGFHFRGGQAKAVAALADYLASSSHPVHLVGHEFDHVLSHSANVTIHQVPRPFRTDAFGNVLLARAGRSVAQRVTAAAPDARVVVNGGNCNWADINWVHYLHAAFAPDLRTAPVLFRVKERCFGNWYRRKESRSIRAARLVIANSQRTKADVVRCLEIPGTKVKTIYYGTDPTWTPPTSEERYKCRQMFGLHSDRPVVVFVGGFGFDNRKGYDTLLSAWSRLSESPEWDAELVLAGGGNASSDVSKRIGVEFSGRVKTIGFTDRVFDLLAAADLLVSPVRYEPYGLNVQEAICRGVPAIVSAVAGVAEEYPPELADAVLSNPDDPIELANRLQKWRGNLNGWKERFQPLSNRLRLRTWDTMAREIVTASTQVSD
jgi:glycosyltransferase involved in cell wall biosynthesis